MASKIDYRSISKTKMPLVILTHPVEGYEEMRWNKKSSMLMANLILVVFFFTTIISQQYTGFVFNTYRPEQLNVVTVFFTTFVLFALWVIANMGVCTLNDGEGSFQDVWVNTAYALIPYIICSLLAVLVSNFVVSDEAVFYTAFITVGLMWSAVLLFLGLKTAHQFTLGKTVASVILTLLGMIIIVFVILLTFALIQKMIEFVSSIYNEIRYRV